MHTRLSKRPRHRGRRRRTMGAGPRLARLVALAVAMVAMLALGASSASAAAVQPLAGCDTNTLPANDDGSTDVAVPIGFDADFFGAPFNQVWINNNGNVSLDQPFGKYTPWDFTISGDRMIAPFLADVDTTGAASRQVTYGTTTLPDGREAFCVDWVGVGYYLGHDDKTNSFQL